MTDKRIEAVARVIHHDDNNDPNDLWEDAGQFKFMQTAEQALKAADAADDHVRIPRANLEAMLRYIDVQIERTSFDVDVSALCAIGDDLQEWQQGHFKPVPKEEK